MKIVFYNETLICGGIEKCLELLSKELAPHYEIEIVYIDDTFLDKNIVKVLSQNAYVHKLQDTEIINADICIWCRIYFDYKKLTKQIVAKRNFLWVHSEPRYFKNCILDNSQFMNTVEKIICVSEEVRTKVGFPDKSVVIHNFVNNNIHELASKIEDPLSDVSDNCLKLLIVSRISSDKGFDRVEQFIKDLKKINCNFILKIIGTGRNLEPIMRTKLGKYKQVEFLGYKDNPYTYMKNSDCLLVLSDYETWGNVITESKTLGTPCIVTNFPSAKEQIEDGKNGIIIPLKCDDYSQYIKSFLSKKNDLKQSLNSFTYINETDKWYDILNLI